METKPCTGCKRELPVEEYRWDNIAKGRRKPKCGECENRRMREDRAKHRDKRRAYDRARYRGDAERRYIQKAVRSYGLALKQAEILARKRHCDLCGRDNGGRRMALDHCHTTGKLRGLLCDSCNIGLGKFRDNPHTLRLARKYVLRGGFGGYEPLTDEELVAAE